MDAEADTPEVAFYYPGPVWRSPNWIKNLILFFDGVGLLIPRYIKDKPEIVDPAIAEGLKNEGLLYKMEPEQIVDEEATKKLASAMTDIIASGAFDSLGTDREYHALSFSRLGGFGNRELANMVLEELQERNLAEETRDGLSIPIHPLVRGVVLVLLSQILRPHGDTMGVRLSPATDRPRFIASLREILSIPGAPSRGNIISFDLETVGVDLGPVPLDEVLDFRREHGKEYREYSRSVRRFTRQLSRLEPEEREQAFKDREEELEDIAAELENRSLKAWKRPASFALGMAGAAWTVAGGGDPVGAVLTTAAGLLGGSSGQHNEAGAYSYLFQASERYA